MNIRPHLFVVILAAAAAPFVAVSGASAQEAQINFVCGAGTTLLGTSGGSNLCPTSGSANPFYSWSQQGFTVTNTNDPSTTTEYNGNQGDTAPGGARVVGDPSASSLGTALSGQISLTVTDTNGLFEFNEVDLSSTGTGFISYSITGTNSGNSADDFTLSCGGARNPTCPTGGPDYTTILGGADSTDLLTSLTIVETPASSDYAYLDQLYVTNVPEGGTGLMFLLLAGGACSGAMFFNSRNRLANLTEA
jgi:hypothetical protein